MKLKRIMLLNKLKNNTLLIGCKLMIDLLFILLIFFAIALFAEGLIPGIISAHFSFLKIIFILSLNLFALYLVGNYLKIGIEKQKSNKKTIIFLIAFGIVLIFNSLLRLNIFLNIFILFVIIATGYLIYKNILE